MDKKLRKIVPLTFPVTSKPIVGPLGDDGYWLRVATMYAIQGTHRQQLVCLMDDLDSVELPGRSFE